MKRLALAVLVGVSLAVLTTATYLVFLAWDQHKDVDALGHATGPYQAWQIVGVVLATRRQLNRGGQCRGSAAAAARSAAPRAVLRVW